MSDLIFTPHARDEMARDNLTEDDVYQVVADADDSLEYDDGRTRYPGTLDDGRELVVIIEDDGETVVTVWWWKRRRPRWR